MKKPAGRPPKYPFGALSTGDRFTIAPLDEVDLNRIRMAAYTFGKRNGVKFKTRMDSGVLTIKRVE